MYAKYPAEAIIAALSVQYTGSGNRHLMPYALQHLSISLLKAVFELTPPATATVSIPYSLAQLTVLDVSESTTDC